MTWLRAVPLFLACGSNVTATPPDGGPDSETDASVADTTPSPPDAAPVLEHHNGPSRNGVYTVAGLTRAKAATIHQLAPFPVNIPGQLALTPEGGVNAQPLYLANGAGGAGAYYVVTESNDVLAFSETDGTILFQKNVGAPAQRISDPCKSGAIPLGITGTPIIDAATRTLYVDSVVSGLLPVSGQLGIKTHLIHALSVDDGTERIGWPVDPTGLTANGNVFDPTAEHQRGALAIADGMLYVPYGGMGDCGPYHGWVVGVPLADPAKPTAWAPTGPAAGVWAPSGVASDGTNIFFATGNGGPAGTPPAWAGGEGVFRFQAGGALPSAPADSYFAPNWPFLDSHDLDLGGSGVTLVKLAGSTPSELALALGKDGNLYMLDAMNLAGGGDAGTPQVVRVANQNIVDAPAVVSNAKGAMLVFDAQSSGAGVGCPTGQSGDLVGVQITSGDPPTAAVAWCVDNAGNGSPMITTTDGSSEAIVWITSDRSGKLNGYDALTGATVFLDVDGTQGITGTYRFNTLIAANGRLVIAGNTNVYVFATSD